MELLSPAGSYEALIAAVRCGADAVYLGGNRFNARINAANFNDELIVKALDYCHMCNTRVFVTLNTSLHERDIFSALKYAEFLYESGVDAVIVQDLGLITLLKKYLPELELHVSTQLGISSLSGVKECESLGADRVVLSRELSVDKVKDIIKNTSLPIEVFVHGAMCMSFSGACLMSALIGGRSGNCGSCAQPCRKNISVTGNTDEYHLSLGDMCMLEHVDELRKIGVASLKIEGRMKKPEYVACATKAYRRVIDGASPAEIAELSRELRLIFNRGEHTTGYWYGDNCHTNGIASAAGEQSLISKVRELYSNETRRLNIDMRLEMTPSEPAVLITESNGITVKVEGETVQQAKSPVTDNTRNKYKELLSKLGGTVFAPGMIEVINDSAYLSSASVNELRRRAIEKTEEQLKLRRVSHANIPSEPQQEKIIKSDNSKDRKLSVRVNDYSQAEAAFECGIDEITVEYGSMSEPEIEKLQSFRKSCKIIAALPAAMTEARAHYEKYAPNDKFDGIEVNNIGQLCMTGDYDFALGGVFLNVFNSYSANELIKRGLDRVMLSLELKQAQARDITYIVGGDRLSLYAYGRATVMNLVHCPKREYLGCGKCKSEISYMTDGDGRKFLLMPMKNKLGKCESVRLCNCFPHDLSGLISKGAVTPMTVTLNMTDESPSEVKAVIAQYRSALSGEFTEPMPNTTRGYWRS